jgi:Mg/Co/Ni transporter MgtE
MEAQKTNREVMTTDFSTTKADANLQEAFEGIKKTLEGSPPPSGLIVVGKEGKYAGVLTLDDFMDESSENFIAMLATRTGKRN